MGREVDVPAARCLDCLAGGWPSGAHEARGLDPVFLAEVLAEYHRCIWASADVPGTDDEDRWRCTILLQAGDGASAPRRMQNSLAGALQRAQ